MDRYAAMLAVVVEQGPIPAMRAAVPGRDAGMGIEENGGRSLQYATRDDARAVDNNDLRRGSLDRGDSLVAVDAGDGCQDVRRDRRLVKLVLLRDLLQSPARGARQQRPDQCHEGKLRQGRGDAKPAHAVADQRRLRDRLLHHRRKGAECLGQPVIDDPGAGAVAAEEEDRTGHAKSSMREERMPWLSRAFLKCSMTAPRKAMFCSRLAPKLCGCHHR